MKIIKLKLLTAVITALLLVGVAQGQPTNYTTTFTPVNLLIPDGNPVGLASSTNLSGVLGTIDSVSVTLNITGGFNGDLYAYLAGPAGGFAVLLNRTGLTSGNAFGYNDTGFNITLSDGSPDIHTYQLDTPTYSSGQLTGTWAPDGRNIDPQSTGGTFDSTSPSALLNSFVGANPNSTWTLFVADMSGGGQATLVSWGLTVVTVPEPQTWALAVGGVITLLVLNRRRKL